MSRDPRKDRARKKRRRLRNEAWDTSPARLSQVLARLYPTSSMEDLLYPCSLWGAK